MFKTITMAKLLVKQEHFNEALVIIEELLREESSNELLLLKAMALEGIDENNKAENIVMELIENGYSDENVYKLLEKIYTKTGRNKTNDDNVPLEEMAITYEKIGDTENAIKYYEKKINQLKNKMEDNYE